MNQQCFKPVTIEPLTGPLDTRSTPDLVPFGGWRWLLNYEVPARNKLCRLTGWRKFLDQAPYNNQDLHDQLFGFTRQPISYLYQAESPAGFSKQFACTDSRIYALNNSTGNWNVIFQETPTTTTCPDRAWWCCNIGEVVIFTNGTDIFSHIIDQPTEAGGVQSVVPIRDLTTLSITKVGFCVAWNNMVFLCNVVQDGTRFTYRVVWGDYQRPLSFLPKASTSLAGFKDFEYGEVILNAAPMGNSLMFYTNRGVWQCTVSGDDKVFTFVNRYQAGRNAKNAIAYPRTLVSDGTSHWYFGIDGIYRYDYYVPDPVREEWVHAGTAHIFDTIDPVRCAAHHGGFEILKKKIWFAWTKVGEDCPAESFTINTEYPFTCYVDNGFTAFSISQPDRLMALRDFIIENCICTAQEIGDAGFGFRQEGGFCTPEVAPDCPVRPLHIWTSIPLAGDDYEVEDYDQLTASADSFCALFGQSIDDLCGKEFLSDACSARQAFCMADAVDNCLKESADVYYREQCTRHAACGAWTRAGYVSLQRSGALDLRYPDARKTINAFTVEPHPQDQTVPSILNLRVGVSRRPIDPNLSDCTIMWQQQDPKELRCLDGQTEAQHLLAGTQDDESFTWPLELPGWYHYFELTITNPAASPPNTGGACCFSRVSFPAGNLECR